MRTEEQKPEWQAGQGRAPKAAVHTVALFLWPECQKGGLDKPGDGDENFSPSGGQT